MGIVGPLLINPWIHKVSASVRIIREHGTDLELLILQSQEKALPISLTLSSGKVYVGFCMEPPDPTRGNDYLTILPTVSGYRDKETQRVTFTTIYQDVYARISRGEMPGLEAKDFNIVLRVDEILYATLYSESLDPGIFDIPPPEQREGSGDQ
jgi:hypothetical protein